jgi:hypothetical protein
MVAEAACARAVLGVGLCAKEAHDLCYLYMLYIEYSCRRLDAVIAGRRCCTIIRPVYRRGSTLAVAPQHFPLRQNLHGMSRRARP